MSITKHKNQGDVFVKKLFNHFSNFHIGTPAVNWEKSQQFSAAFASHLIFIWKKNRRYRTDSIYKKCLTEFYMSYTLKNFKQKKKFKFHLNHFCWSRLFDS